MQVYIFVYNVIYVKCDFTHIVDFDQRKLVLIASPYCLRELSASNRSCFDRIYQIDRDFHSANSAEITEIVSHYVHKYGKENVSLLTNEESAQLICAQLRESLDLKGVGVAEIEPFVNKVVCKNKLAGKVNLPKFSLFDKQAYQNTKDAYLDLLEQQIGYPMFSKPIDLVSSIETNKISSREELKKISERIMTLDYQFEIDEFIDGELFHGDILLINGEVKFFMAGQCSFALSCFFEGKPVGSIPVNDPTLFKKLKDFFVQALMVLNPRSGAYHMEVFRDRKTGELVFLEVGARTGGALITKVYEKIYGFNVEEVNYKIQMGLCDDFSYEDPHIYAGFLNFPTINGVLTQIVDLPPMEIEYQFINFFREQSIACQAKNLLDISSSILFWDESFERVAETFERLKNHTPVIYNDNLEFILKQNELCLRPAETWHYSPLRRAAA